MPSKPDDWNETLDKLFELDQQYPWLGQTVELEPSFVANKAYDTSHSADEGRYVTTGAHPDDRRIVLVIAWTDRSTKDARVTRIISARLATAAEGRAYGEEISQG